MSLFCQSVFSGYMAECDKKLLSISTHHILQHNTPQWLSTLAEGDIKREFAFSNLPRVISKLCCVKHLKCAPGICLSSFSSLYTSNYIVRSLQRGHNTLQAIRSVCPTESAGPHSHNIHFWVNYPFKGKYCVLQHTLDKVRTGIIGGGLA